MLRTIFSVGIMAVLGLFLLKFAFGILGGLFALLIFFGILAIKIGLIGLAVYVVIRVLSPDTARRLRERWSGSGT